MKNNQIKEIASQTRKEITEKFGSTTSVCEAASKLLHRKLTENQISSQVIFGSFHLDFPTKQNKESTDYYAAPHFWVETENLIVDITADQFNEEVGEEYPEIYITQKNKSGRHSKQTIIFSLWNQYNETSKEN
jgi:hypothetical protein